MKRVKRVRKLYREEVPYRETPLEHRTALRVDKDVYTTYVSSVFTSNGVFTKIIPTLQCSIGTWMGSVFSRTRGFYAPGGTLSTVYVALDNNGGELRKQCGRSKPLYSDMLSALVRRTGCTTWIYVVSFKLRELGRKN